MKKPNKLLCRVCGEIIDTNEFVKHLLTHKIKVIDLIDGEEYYHEDLSKFYLDNDDITPGHGCC